MLLDELWAAGRDPNSKAGQAVLVTQAGTASQSSSALTTSCVTRYLLFTPAGVGEMGKLRH